MVAIGLKPGLFLSEIHELKLTTIDTNALLHAEFHDCSWLVIGLKPELFLFEIRELKLTSIDTNALPSEIPRLFMARYWAKPG
jgi:hypothetical protein